ncbi:hypothetical protein FHG64_12025 [Antarcticibacterium flavum]|uniref:Uncharacterized protein n=1 Tax=Antarcticibacterium flavum TaxID=2058175 RepID=A0A5B7X5Q1_9FLAO|nr:MULTISPECIES: hypothetical protein [Antarcticibacterium]MCM4158302.1 hypothetical protein [Antarcticibacterium sp. W02-3]QCY70068.1 hypothetical protein FHG64_12025 [Antarcticibacterium flavum]
MKEIVKPHYQDEDIQRINLCTDVNNWKSELSLIEVENRFYAMLFKSKLIDVTEINQQDINFLIQELESLDKSNTSCLDRILVFYNELEGMMECDDVQCDTYYLNNYQQFKVDMENHFHKNRYVKNLIYSYMKTGIKKFL